MFLIISFHYVYHGDFSYKAPLTTEIFLLKIFWLFGELGVNSFFLISGYFMSNHPVRPQKIFRLMVQVWCYYIPSCIIVWIVSGFSASPLRVMLKMFCPIIRNAYWFVTVYLLICLFSPWLIQLLNVMTQKSHAALLAMTFCLWSLIPTGLGWLSGVESTLYYTRFCWGVIMWLWGVYIRRYSLPVIHTRNRSLALATISFSLAVLAIPVISRINQWTGQNFEIAYFWPPNTVLMFFMSLGLFGVFLNLELPYNKWISIISSCTLGIYLLHAGPLESVFWQKIFQNVSHQGSPLLIVHIIGGTLAIFAVGVVIDLLRQQFEQRFFEHVNRYSFPPVLQTVKKWSVTRFDNFFAIPDEE